MRMVVCDNGLNSLDGHPFNLALGLRAQARERQINLDILAHMTLPPGLAERLDARPAFYYTPYSRMWRSPAGEEQRDLARVGGRYAADLATMNIGNPDLVFVPTARPAEVYGLAEWLRQSGARPIVALNFMIADPGSQRAGVLESYRLAFEHLYRIVPPGRVILSSSAAALAEAVAGLAGQEVAVYPMPKFVPDPTGIARPPNPVPVIGVLGNFNADQRGAIMAQVASIAAQRDLACRFLVQGPWQVVRTDFAAAYLALCAAPNVELILTELDFDGYFSALFACDIVMLPYDAKRYATMTSGIFAEAVAFGKISIVPEGTWMSHNIDAGRGAGVSFDGLRPEILVGAIERVLNQLDPLQERARAAATVWRKTDGLGAFVDRLLADFAARTRGR